MMAEVRLSNRKHSARVKEWEEERAAAGPLVCGALDSVVDTVITEAVRASAPDNLLMTVGCVAELGWLCGGPQEVARKLELGVLEGEVAGNRQAQQQLLRQQGEAEVTRRRRRRRRAADDDWGDSGSDGEGRSARGAGGKRQGGGSARGTAGRKAGRKGGAQLRALQQQGQSLSHDLERLRRVDAIETKSAVQDAVEWMIRWLEEERDAASRDAERRAKEAEAARVREASERRAAELEARLAALEAEVRAQKEATASAAAVETALRRERLAEIIQQGDAAMEGGRWRAALGHYEAALEIDPEDEEALRKKKAALAAGEKQGGSSAQGGKGRKGKQGRQSKGGRRRKGGAAGAGSGSGSESEYSEYEGSDGEVRTRRSKRQAERRDKDGKGQADGRGGKQPGQKAKKRSKAEVRSTLACCCSVRAGCLEASAQPERALLAAFCS